MVARLELCAAMALLLVTGANAGADPYTPSAGSATPNIGAPPPSLSGYSAAASPIERSSEADAYNRAAINDPYNRPDFTPLQSFGLAASQMLGAAAACEQHHSDLMNLDTPRSKAPKDSGDEARTALDAGQQHMLDPAGASANQVSASEADCDRVSGSFTQLQQIQIRDQDLAKSLDQPDAMSPSPNSGNNRGAATSRR